jgi:DNA adenine methylase
MIPPFENYIEPFFGGGGIFFAVQPKKAIINDISSDLMDFYRFVKGEKDRDTFKIELYRYVDNWEKITKLADLVKNDFSQFFKLYRSNHMAEKEVDEKIEIIVTNYSDQLNGFFKPAFCINVERLVQNIVKNIKSKLKRIRKIEINENKTFTDDEMEEHLETAIRSGFYMHFREILNLNKKQMIKISEAKAIANYYFIREFCYASMFRFNVQGDFNIPYGGIAYNRKNFRKKVDMLFSNEVQGLFQNVTIENIDFEQFFKKHQFGETNFIFFDPPYDTEFSEYDLNQFTKKDQERLAKVIYGLKAKFILIIKNTPFIYDLYAGHKNIKISSFKKNYLYNVRGRNDRETEHLIIYNF